MECLVSKAFKCPVLNYNGQLDNIGFSRISCHCTAIISTQNAIGHKSGGKTAIMQHLLIGIKPDVNSTRKFIIVKGPRRSKGLTLKEHNESDQLSKTVQIRVHLTKPVR